MIDEHWFATRGDFLLRQFCRTIEQTYRHGIEQGLTPRPNMDDVLRVYRGGGVHLSEASKRRIRDMVARGYSQRQIGEVMGIAKSQVWYVGKVSK